MQPLPIEVEDAISLMDQFDDCKVECDGFVRLSTSALQRYGIEHECFYGTVTVNGEQFAPHFWIMVEGHVIDYRLRMWFGDDAPHGVVDSDNESVSYDGTKIEVDALSEKVFNILSGMSLAAMSLGS